MIGSVRNNLHYATFNVCLVHELNYTKHIKRVCPIMNLQNPNILCCMGTMSDAATRKKILKYQVTYGTRYDFTRGK